MPLWMKIIVGIYAVLCILAIAVGLVGTLGLFGTRPDGLAGVFAIMLSLPWGLWALPEFGSSEIASEIIVVLCMALNAAILVGIGMLFGRRRARA